jgi:hypothetical protein
MSLFLGLGGSMLDGTISEMYYHILKGWVRFLQVSGVFMHKTRIPVVIDLLSRGGNCYLNPSGGHKRKVDG